MSKNICFIDFETTGPDPLEDRPVQIGASLYYAEGNPTRLFESNIHQTKESTKIALGIHGLSVADLKDAPTEVEVMAKFFEEIETDYCFAAWNTNFDVTFFRALCKRTGYEQMFQKIYYRHIELQSIGRLLMDAGILSVTGKPNMDAFLAQYGLRGRERGVHNALDDAKLTSALYFKFLATLRNFGDKG